MKITTEQINDAALSEFGVNAISLVKEGNYEKIGEIFGYALAHGEKHATAIKSELESCFKQAGENTKIEENSAPNITVKYFEPNNTGLIAVVECLLPFENSAGEILIELIVAGNGEENHVSLEQISYAA